MKYFYCLLFSMLMIAAPFSVRAQCVMPSGPPAEAGVILFNDDHRVMQYCNGEQWIGLWGGGGGGAGLPDCESGEIAQFTAGEWQCSDGSSIDNLNASNLKSGTIPDARFPATLPAVSGTNLTNLNATRLTAGTVPTARLGTGTANSTTFLRGDGAWAAPSAGGGLALGDTFPNTTMSCPVEGRQRNVSLAAHSTTFYLGKLIMLYMGGYGGLTCSSRYDGTTWSACTCA